MPAEADNTSICLETFPHLCMYSQNRAAGLWFLILTTDKGEYQMLTQFQTLLAMLMSKLRKNETGQTMVEYVMLIVLVALAVFLSSPSITSAVMGVFTATSSTLVP